MNGRGGEERDECFWTWGMWGPPFRPPCDLKPLVQPLRVPPVRSHALSLRDPERVSRVNVGESFVFPTGGTGRLRRVRTNKVFLIVLKSLPSPSPAGGESGMGVMGERPGCLHMGLKSDCAPRSGRNVLAPAGVVERAWLWETHKPGFGPLPLHLPAA